MAKTSAVEKNKRREKLVKRYAEKRARLKAIVMDQSLPLDERFRATIQLAELPRNSAKVRVRNRCEITGRPRAYYRKLKMSRIALRQYGSLGQVPGVVKSSW
ncbi:30S ribosomal protein S14 [Falsochrobactrum ovis]|uniref:Small ribosomal subunit protein uS14 n=1 Tax=Falsochrobactrum ovis TaxID=1293442 RepID=A0A364JXV1_9HYPH|nr:30S ribosomal protein S14 [Falsochrobactrum ovis]RAK32286.1 SSU ribosomal protein S14P [Falsochrobactrum ovis]